MFKTLLNALIFIKEKLTKQNLDNQSASVQNLTQQAKGDHPIQIGINQGPINQP